MKLLLVFILLASSSFGNAILGAWQSDCQNASPNNEGYLSLRPVDTFTADGRVSLRIHVFERRNCAGKEWDQIIIPCTYVIGPEVAGLEATRELDLRCEMEGTQNWYEIVQIKDSTLRYGNATGESPQERPKALGNVIYRRMN